LIFYEGFGVGPLKIEESEPESEVLKIEESESELLCTDSTALPTMKEGQEGLRLRKLHDQFKKDKVKRE
jgi:hypothetical protein